MYRERYRHIFEEKAATRFPKQRHYDHAIDLIPGAPLPKTKGLYSLTWEEQQELDKWIKEQLEKGYIRESKSPFAAPFFYIKKKGGKELRPIQDYRGVNKITIKNEYPLPLISELIETLKGASIFTKMDLRWGYNNVRIKDGDQYKAAFKTNRGLFEPMVMFFGLQNSPATFQAMMNDILMDLILKKQVIVYMDDILIFSTNQNEQDEITLEVLKRLEENDLYLKPTKCFFNQKEILYLGLRVSHNKVTTEEEKIEALTKWEPPKTVKGVLKILGFANFYRQFVEGFADIVRPLTNMTRKGEPFKWTETEQKAFDTIRQKLIEAPVLRIPDQERKFRLTTDASDCTYGAVLEQPDNKGKWHPIGYLSKKMNPAEENYDIHDKELLAIIRATEHWRHLLEGSKMPFEIWTDHKNLLYFEDAESISRRQARWALWLTRFNFTMDHRPGANNRADALTRRPELGKKEQENLRVRVIPTEKWKSRRTEINIGRDPILEQELKDKKQLDEQVTMALNGIKEHPLKRHNEIPEWETENEIIIHRGKIYVPKNVETRKKVIRMYHDSPMVGHPGEMKTLELVKRTFWWPNMTKDTKNYVQGCPVCQTTKIRTNDLPVALQPTEIPTKPWEEITADFVTDLPESQGHDSILNVVDKFSKTVIMIPCRKDVSAEETGKLLRNNVLRRYGPWKKIITDRGPQFASKSFEKILSEMGSRGALSTAFHPQTDGETERINQEMEQYLRAFCQNNQTDWTEKLAMAEYAHNCKEHSATKKSPFEIIHGYKPAIHPEWEKGTQSELTEIWKETQAALEIAAREMKHYHDRKGTQEPLEIGQKVWMEGKNLKLKYPNKKLAPKRIGPFEIERKIGATSYKIKLPTKWNIHPVIHQSLLTPVKETEIYGEQYSRPEPDIINEQEEWEVEAIINERKDKRRKKQQMYLVKWKGHPSAENTWEPEANLEHAQDKVKEFWKGKPRRQPEGGV